MCSLQLYKGPAHLHIITCTGLTGVTGSLGIVSLRPSSASHNALQKRDVGRLSFSACARNGTRSAQPALVSRHDGEMQHHSARDSTEKGMARGAAVSEDKRLNLLLLGALPRTGVSLRNIGTVHTYSSWRGTRASARSRWRDGVDRRAVGTAHGVGSQLST